MHKGLKVDFLNVRSLYSKFGTIAFELNPISPDVININETRLQNTLPDHFVNIPHYSLIRNDRTTNLANGAIKRGRGLCAYIRQGLN